MTSRLNRLRAALTGVTITVLLGGCGMLGATGESGGSASGGSGENGAAQESPQQSPPTPQTQNIMKAPAIATGTLIDNGDELKVEVVGLRRTSDRLVRLDLRVTAINDPGYILTAYFSHDLGAVDGISLVDGDAGKRYMVVYDSEDQCLCTSGRNALSQGDQALVYAYFPAPPASVKAVDVVIPNMVPFSEVQISG